MDKFIDSSGEIAIFKNNGIERPSYEEITKYQDIVKSPFELKKEAILRDLALWLGTEFGNVQEIADKIYMILSECKGINLSETIIKNIYIRISIAIKTVFKGMVKNKGSILYLGSLDKYDFVILTVLGELGVNILVIDLEDGKPTDYLCNNRFEIQEGIFRESLSYKSIDMREKGLKDLKVHRNTWINFNNCREPKDYLEILNRDNRYEENSYKTVNLEIAGVTSDYPSLINDFMRRIKAINKKHIVFENGIDNPTFDENENFNQRYSMESLKIEEILNAYPSFKKTSIQLELNNYIDKILNRKNFSVENQKLNYKKVIYIWLIRYLDMFFTEKIENEIPLIIIWGSLNQREEEFIGFLSLFPIDIVHFAPDEAKLYGEMDLMEVFKVKIGDYSKEYHSIPEANVIDKVATVAYQAERELDTLLYSGTEGLYRPNQFKDIAPVVLKTTYDEIGILWDKPAKFRPSFETMGNLVKVGTIFAKVNGVNNREEYLSKIREMIIDETIIHQKLPFTIENRDESLSGFVRQVVFNRTVDFQKIKTSRYYKYHIYSEETQELIISKIEQLLTLDWCNQDVRNLMYITMEVLLNLDTKMVQMIHSYDFTNQIPKIMLFSGDTGVCSLEDCIVIMFLKLIGFDILILAPTGYRLIEHYIKPILFNDITIGDYDFDMQNMDIRSKIIKKTKKGFFRNIFGN